MKNNCLQTFLEDLVLSTSWPAQKLGKKDHHSIFKNDGFSYILSLLLGDIDHRSQIKEIGHATARATLMASCKFSINQALACTKTGERSITAETN